MPSIPQPQQVRSKPTTHDAIWFDGAEAKAKDIFAWVQETVPGFKGHFRPGVGDQPGALFIPTAGGAVLSMSKGDWIIKNGNTLWVTTAEKFAEAYEVVECLPQ
jgi:hypothetical protein